MKASAKTFIVFTLGLVAGGLLWVGIKDQLLRVRTIEIVTDDQTSDSNLQPLKAALNNKLIVFYGRFAWNVPIDEILKIAKSDGRVRSATAQRIFPGRVVLHVGLREAIVNAVDNNGRLVPVAIDGTLMPIPENPFDRPILRGAQFMKEPGLRARIANQIAELPEEGLFSQKSISEIHFKPKSGFELVLMKHGTRVLVAEDELSQKSSRIEQVLNYLENQRIEGRVIDVRFSKKVVVKPRNQP